MFIRLVKQNGKTVGWTMIAENEEDRLRLGSIRNMQFFGMSDTAITYGGMMALKEDERYAQQLAWVQKGVRKEFDLSKLDSDMNMPANDKMEE